MATQDLRLGELPWLIDNDTGLPVGVQVRGGEAFMIPGFRGTDYDRSLMGGKLSASAGLRMAVIGASTEARAQTMWNVPPANYQRVNGLVTVTYDYTLQDKRWLPGHQIRLAADKRADLEGLFEVVTSTISAGVSGTVTYRDNRADVAAGSVSGTVVMALHDTHTHAITGGWPAFTNLSLGGRLDIVTIATGSTNTVSDWLTDRVDQIVAQGPFDIVFIGCGILGNAINGGGYNVTRTYNGLCDTLRKIADKVRPRVILVETLPPSAAAAMVPTNPVVTAAYRLNRMLWRDLQRQFPFVRVVACGEAMVTNYSAYNASPSADVQNGWAEANAMATDGVHPMFAWSRVRGQVVADALRSMIAPWASPEMGAYPDTRQVNNVADAEGLLNPNWLPGLWGNVDATKATLTGTGISGVGPAGASASFEAGRGASTLVGSLQTNPAGGADWVCTVSGAGSASGFTLALSYAPAALLSALQSALVQGKKVDLFLPITLQINPLKILWASIDLVATVGGVEYVLASCQAQDGQFTQAAQGRAMDAGYSGVFRFPRFKVPTATYTAAKFRVRIKEINGSVASGATVLRWGPGQRFEVLEG